MVTSFPKEKIKILLLEGVSDAAVRVFKAQGYSTIECLKGALGGQDLIDAVKDVHILGIRSKTEITAEILKHAPKLLTIGCYCIGTNQVALDAASQKGIAVFNSPYSNTRSVAEIVLANIIHLLRQIPQKHKKALQGIWQKESKNCFEIRGKTVGIIGYGHIGSQLSVMAEALGMQVIYYDIVPKLPLGNAKPVADLTQLLTQSDVVTIHVPGMPSTENLIGEKELKQMKSTAVLINYSRGKVVDLDALKQCLENNHLLGAAIDVFPIEPKEKGDPFISPLQQLDNVILTPHIGGSTEEAQENIGKDVSFKMVSFLDTGNTVGSHSLPEINLPLQSATHRILHVHQNVPGVISELNTCLASYKINILGQYLATNQQVGYVVLDIQNNNTVVDAALEALKKVNHTLKTRILF